MSVALIWPIGGGVSVLGLPGGETESKIWACNTDGSVLVGQTGPEFSGTPARWDGTTYSALATVSGALDARYLSRAATILMGTTGSFGSDYPRWTSGGSVGGTLTPLATYTRAIPGTDGGLDIQARISSDDGTKIVGSCSGGHVEVATIWTNGTPVALPPSLGGSDVSVGGLINEGGTRVFGIESQGATSPIATYWDVGVSISRLLRRLPASNSLITTFLFCNGAGTVVWGRAADASAIDRFVYWDNLTATSIDPLTAETRYGDIHVLSDLSNGIQELIFASETNTVAVGNMPLPVSGVAPVRWNSTAITNLGGLPGGVGNGHVYACSGDGAIAGGNAGDADGNGQPVYWDVSNVIHQLPMPSGYTNGIVTAISRDGTMLFGIGDAPVVDSSVASVGDLFFTPTSGFIDLSDADNRRKFINADGCAVPLGGSGSTPLGVTPAVFLTIPPSGTDPNTLAANFGSGGTFTLTGGDLTFSATAPCCSTTTITSGSNNDGVADPQIMLSVSDDGAHTWSVLQKWRSMGRIGEYLTRLRWLKMGQFRQRIIKLEITDAVRRNILGVYQDVNEGME